MAYSYSLTKTRAISDFLKSIKNYFWPKNKGFLSFCFTIDEEIFVVLNPSEKQREKHMFPKSLSHNMTGKLIFSQKRVN